MTSPFIQNILQEFNLQGSQFTATPLTAGLINDTYLVTDGSEQQYILQKINLQVFPNAAMLMDNINHALPLLHAENYARITFLTTRTGANFLIQQTDIWRMMTYISDSTTYNTTTNSTIAFEAGRIIGLFHKLLEKADIQLFKDTLPKFHNLHHRIQEFEDALCTANSQNSSVAAVAIEKARHFIKELQEIDNEKLPVRICHNDTKLNNILFSKSTEKALCLIDLDTIMKGYFHYDFGDAIRTIVNTAPEDEQNHDLITFEKTLFESFVDGLASNGQILTLEEKNSLALGAVFMPFIHGLRALTDYLNNNTYYKVTYQNQNLDRCLSLFYFAEKALQHKDYMTTYILEKLG